MDKDSNELNLGELEVKIQEIVGRINNDAASRPEELEEIKKLIKKNVPFFTRSAFSAYLLREFVARHSHQERKPRNNEYRKDRAARTEEKKEEGQSSPAPQKKEERIIPEGAKTLYLNVGKMKHLYAKTLSQILQNELGITRDDIYSIRIHDKYSFITMSEENCNKAIEVLNGKEINGRVCQVNYSNR